MIQISKDYLLKQTANNITILESIEYLKTEVLEGLTGLINDEILGDIKEHLDEILESNNNLWEYLGEIAEEQGFDLPEYEG